MLPGGKKLIVNELAQNLPRRGAKFEAQKFAVGEVEFHRQFFGKRVRGHTPSRRITGRFRGRGDLQKQRHRAVATRCIFQMASVNPARRERNVSAKLHRATCWDCVVNRCGRSV